MAAITRFLNQLWISETNVDLLNHYSYADRVRMRPPGSASLGLSPHVDGGALLSGGWMKDVCINLFLAGIGKTLIAGMRPQVCVKKLHHRLFVECFAPFKGGQHFLRKEKVVARYRLYQLLGL